MKKMKALLFTAVLMLVFAGCGKMGKEETEVYSFSGADERFAVSNGVIFLSGEEQIFKGGNLKVVGELPEDIVFYSTTFYVKSGGETKTILSNSVEETGGDSLELSDDLGKISGKEVFDRTILNGQEDWKNLLYFELTVRDKRGNEWVYPLQMSLSEVTNHSKKIELRMNE